MDSQKSNIVYKKQPAPILTKKLNIPEEEVKKYIKYIKSSNDRLYHRTNVKAKISSFTLHKETRLFNPLINKICQVIQDEYDVRLFELNKTFKKKEKNKALERLKDFKNSPIKLFEFWSIEYELGQETILHDHIPYEISFCFYLQSNENTSKLIFDGCNYSIQPFNNLLVVFPGWLTHSVTPNQEDQSRICVCGNISKFW